MAEQTKMTWTELTQSEACGFWPVICQLDRVGHKLEAEQRLFAWRTLEGNACAGDLITPGCGVLCADGADRPSVYLVSTAEGLFLGMDAVAPRTVELRPADAERSGPCPSGRVFACFVSVPHNSGSRCVLSALLYGGCDARKQALDDTWLLHVDMDMPAGAEWPRPWPVLRCERVAGVGDGPPGHRTSATACHALCPRPSVLVFGGCDGRQLYNDLWCFDVEHRRWSRVRTADGPQPPPRTSAAMAASPRGALCVLGGDGPLGRLADAWLLPGSAGPPSAWLPLQLAPALSPRMGLALLAFDERPGGTWAAQVSGGYDGAVLPLRPQWVELAPVARVAAAVPVDFSPLLPADGAAGAVRVRVPHPTAGPRCRSAYDAQVLGEGVVLLPGLLCGAQHAWLRAVQRAVQAGGGLWRPCYDDGRPMHCGTFALGAHWNIHRGRYEPLRDVPRSELVPAPRFCQCAQCDPAALAGGPTGQPHPSAVPPVPVLWREWVQLALHVARTADPALPPMRADLCIVNWYEAGTYLRPHQDREESAASLQAGAPVVSFSVGQPADFLWALEPPTAVHDEQALRAQMHCVTLRSGDALVFGGRARLCWHAVLPTPPAGRAGARAPDAAVPAPAADGADAEPAPEVWALRRAEDGAADADMRCCDGGRLNLTFRQR